MKRFFILTLLVICFTSVQAFAQEEDTQTWDNFIDNADSAGFRKPITQKEYDEAIDTIQNGNLKKQKRHQGSKMPMENLTGEMGLQVQPNVIRLLYNVGYEDVVLSPGYYNISANNNDMESSISFSQGAKTLVKIKAARVKPLFCPNQVNCIKAEPIKDKYLKVYYKDLNVALIGYMYLIED